MGLNDRVLNIVAFLRAGYPTGAPACGYAPVLALLPRRVSDGEVATIATKLQVGKGRSISNVDVGVEITRVIDALPSVDEIARVKDRLSALG
ncbi:DUF3349 domain-containing protein [Mycobacterium sp. HNNTM2301]|uniref:DUF3349 domain-containing protein n=1 Tax=Mycobacterium hainanense TaxID=3289775 RepID=UPI0035A572DB